MPNINPFRAACRFFRTFATVSGSSKQKRLNLELTRVLTHNNNQSCVSVFTIFLALLSCLLGLEAGSVSNSQTLVERRVV